LTTPAYQCLISGKTRDIFRNEFNNIIVRPSLLAAVQKSGQAILVTSMSGKPLCQPSHQRRC
jgi:hypothetical protein